jgi:hypothetical protein
MLITKLEMTCSGCPTQYEGLNSDNQCVYIRYRWGILTLGVGDDLSEAVNNTIFHKDFNDEWDGWMKFSTLKTELALGDIFIDDSIVFSDKW